MKTIEQQIDRKNAINYIEEQVFSVMPLPPDSEHLGQIRIKLQSKHGATNWLNITPEDCQKIEAVLIGSYMRRV